MKRILIVKDGSSCWATVEYLFREVNAEIVSLDVDTNMNLAGAAQPDLVMISGASLSRLPSALLKKPGMAFSAESTFVYGSKVDISLSLPSSNESVRFSLSILRCADEGPGGVRHYGGEYVNMPKDTLKRITSFLYDG